MLAGEDSVEVCFFELLVLDAEFFPLPSSLRFSIILFQYLLSIFITSLRNFKREFGSSIQANSSLTRGTNPFLNAHLRAQSSQLTLAAKELNLIIYLQTWSESRMRSSPKESSASPSKSYALKLSTSSSTRAA